MDNETIREKEKTVQRYLQPLIFNLNPIYRNTYYVITPVERKEYVIIDRQDDFEMKINVTGLSKDKLVMTVLERLFGGAGNEE